MSETEALEIAKPWQEDEEFSCWYCGGEGWGIVGTDWDTDDAINGPYDGEVEKCPCCRCHNLLDRKKNWSDTMECHNCGKKMCNECAIAAMCGDDSYQTLLCPGCLSAS